MAVDDLVLGPFDRSIEQIEIPHVRDAAGPFADDLPFPRRAFHAGKDHRDAMRRQLAELFRDETGAGARQRRDTAQVKDHELRARL